MNATQTTKLVASLVLFVITLLAGYLPVLAVTCVASRRKRRSATITTSGGSFKFGMQNHDTSESSVSINRKDHHHHIGILGNSNHHNVTLKSLVPSSSPDCVPLATSAPAPLAPSQQQQQQRQQQQQQQLQQQHQQPVDSQSQLNLLPSSASNSATSILHHGDSPPYQDGDSHNNHTTSINNNRQDSSDNNNSNNSRTTSDDEKRDPSGAREETAISIKNHHEHLDSDSSGDNYDYERAILNSKWVQAAMFFGGGVLMATAFCHLIPETHDQFRVYLLGSSSASDHHHIDIINSSSSSSLGDAHQPPAATLLDELTSPTEETANDLDNLVTPPAPSESNQQQHLHDHHHESDKGPNLPFIEISVCCGFFFIYILEQLMVKFLDNHSHSPPDDTHTGGADNLLAPDYGPQRGTPSPALVSGSHRDVKSDYYVNLEQSSSEHRLAETRHHQDSCGDGYQQQQRKQVKSTSGNEMFKFLRGLIIVSAFSAHAIFDGVAIGSQASIDQVWAIFLAIACHKLVIAAVVGLELYNATLQSKLWTIVHMTTFSSMSPIGILLVVLAQNSFEININHPVMILLQAFATGTIIYIVFVEILQPKGHDPHKNGLLKSFSLILGFLFMLLVLTLLDDHDHESHH